MKKITTILCIFALCLTLFGCSKPRYPENYSVGEYEGHWSILYTDEDGVEQIADLGAAQQPLVLQGGRLWFTQGSKIVSVNSDGEDRQETELTGMPAGTLITLADESNFYCVAQTTDLTCWRVSKADQTDWAEITIPRAFRTVDYDALTADILAAVQAKEDQMRVRSARVTLDSNGSLATMELEVMAYASIIGGMKTWNTGLVTVQQTLSGPRVDYTNLYVPVSLSDRTIRRTMALEDYRAAVAAVDEAELAAAHGQGEAKGFRLMYLAEEYEAAVTDTLPRVDVTGQSVTADAKAKYFVLAQAGGCSTVVKDSDGTACGNLLVVQLAAE